MVEIFIRQLIDDPDRKSIDSELVREVNFPIKWNFGSV